MREAYYDIRDRIPEPPKWFDCHGTPRYDDFHPELSPSVYADEVVLFEIECQQCRKPFQVELHASRHDRVFHPEAKSLEERVREQRLHYGDPPRHGSRKEDDDGCAAGDTMNCIDRKVLQFWRRGSNTGYAWVRVPELEGIDQEPEWARKEWPD